jgi:hypothetical protein
LQNPDCRDLLEKGRTRMLSEKTDLTALLIWFIENYPDSLVDIKRDTGVLAKFIERGEQLSASVSRA